MVDRREDREMKKIKGGIVLALGLGVAGCSATDSMVKGDARPAPAPVVKVQPQTPAQVDASIEASMDRLRALHVVQVGSLVSELPAEAFSCYGLCVSWAKPYQDERARQASRLATLVLAAEEVSREDLAPAANMQQTGDAAQSLRDLQVIDTTGLESVAVTDIEPTCCYRRCPTEEAEATKENELRLARLIATVELAKKNGI
jgi:hypothetical protein